MNKVKNLLVHIYNSQDKTVPFILPFILTMIGIVLIMVLRLLGVY